jgi:hypothetical protein
MAYDETLAERVRAVLAHRHATTEKKMFGGLAFLSGGRMACGIVGDELMVRVGPARTAEALAMAHVRPMDFTGRPLTGHVFVAPAAIATAADLARWVDLGLAAAAEAPAPRPRKGRRT